MTSRSHSSSRLLNIKDKHDNHDRRDPVFAVAQGIYRMRFCLVLGWVVAAVVMIPFAYEMWLTAVPTMSKAPAGTESSAAMNDFEKHFHNLTTLSHEMISIRCKMPCDSAATTMSKGFVQQFVDMIKRYNYTHQGSVVQIEDYFASASHHQLGENPFISADKQSILLTWVWQVPQNMKAQAQVFCDEIKEEIAFKNAYQGADGLEITATGLVFLDHARTTSLLQDIAEHEVTHLWMPFLILAYALKSPRMLLLALIPMGIELPVAVGIVYFISLRAIVVLDAIMIMLMLCTSLSFDYALFTLTRYAEERAAGANVEDAILTVISQSGRVVVVSGCILVISWAAMLGIPPPFCGFCMATSTMISTCVVVQLTFVPCLLSILPFLGPPAAEKAPTRNAEIEADDFLDVKALDNADKSGRDGHASHDNPKEKAKVHMSGLWFRMGGFVTTWPFNIVLPILVYILMAPFTVRMSKNFDASALRLRMGHSYELTIPRTAPEWKTTLDIQEAFPRKVGILMPMSIMMINEASGVANQESFDLNCQMMDMLITATQNTEVPLTPLSFLSPTIKPDADNGGRVECMKYWEIDFMRTNFLSQHLLLSHTSKHLQQFWSTFVSKDRVAILTTVFPLMDPFSPKAFELAAIVRNSLKQHTQALTTTHPGTTFNMFSAGSIMVDMVDVTSTGLPIAFAVCAGVCLTLIAIWFGAALIPLKLLVTVVMPLTWTFGAGLYVYEDGYLEFLHFQGLSRTGDGGMDWTVPIVTLTFMMGLALDYEIFLFERVREYREEGFGDCESIQLGVAATGSTISLAGLIMALTFEAQLHASVPLTNQVGFILVFSIVIDTFLVRTILVPAMLSLVPCSNYWPSRMPEPRYEWLANQSDPRADDEEDEDDEDDSS